MAGHDDRIGCLGHHRHDGSGHTRDANSGVDLTGQPYASRVIVTGRGLRSGAMRCVRGLERCVELFGHDVASGAGVTG